ncbi:amidohydrolase [Actinopolyspora mzabensis]|uniref:Peptidase M20 domain-containing protein 2 n=1 Tax=Actinopolyspora mzabensis TaxID=995066 RepID=A0A1G9CXS6_ACTMZ|nr:amidohydrolase [Actinopolyspora mzabensis]SDK56442.1 amidohydrolase [Actinopolyspora mzabensis]
MSTESPHDSGHDTVPPARGRLGSTEPEPSTGDPGTASAWRAAVDEYRAELLDLSHGLHADPEISFAEYRAAETVAGTLAAHGFRVQRPVAELDTAFIADYGSGEFVVGLCAEYDALPEVGHACGHNIIAAAAVGAALTLAEHAERLGITVRVLGTPAEEIGGGKVTMLEAGVFDPLAAALMIHPSPTEVCAPRSLAITDLRVHYTGRAAHAAAAPELGVNAADALTVTQVAVGLLRQHLEAGQMVHGIVTSGGAAPNIVPERAAAEYNLRAADPESLARLEDRIRACFEAGGTATGCSTEVVRVSPVYTQLSSDEWLTEAYRRTVVDLGRDPVARAVERDDVIGSTDMGNVSLRVPAVHPMIALECGDAVNHQAEFAAACASPSADRAVLDGAAALARTAAAAALDGDQRERLLAAVRNRTASGFRRSSNRFLASGGVT